MWSQAGVKGHTQTTQQAKARRDGYYLAQILSKEVDDLVAKGAITECVDDGGGFVSPLFLVPKSDGSWRPVINLRDLNLYVAASHFKMESVRTVKTIIQRDNWMLKLDLKDLPLCAHSPSPPEVPQVSVGRQAMAVQGPALWSEQCTPNVHQADEASRFHTEETGVPSHPLPGRHADDGPQQGGGQEGSGRSDGTSLFSGVHHQREEERFYSSPNHRVSGVHSGFSLDDYQPTTAQAQGDKEVSRATLHQQSIPARQLARLLGMIVAAHPAVLPAPLHSRFLERAKRRAVQSQRGYDAMVRLESNAAVVGRLSGQLQRVAPPDPQVRQSDRVRRISEGLGGFLTGEIHRRPMDSGRTETPYELPGTPGGIPGTEIVR